MRETLLTRGVRRVGRYVQSRGPLARLRSLGAEWDAILRPARERLAPVIFADAVDRLDRSWKLPDKQFPLSCTDEEGMVLAEVIRRNDLRSGFEIATAFGYSSLYIAAAMRLTRGRLTSVDCYVEEWKDSFLYDVAELGEAVATVRERVKAGNLPQGFAAASDNSATLGLQNVAFAIAVSPAEIAPLLEGRTVDFAFIDGGHFGDQPQLDFGAIASSLAARCAVFFHDNNSNPSVARAVALAERTLGSAAVVFPTRFRLTLVQRGLKPGTYGWMRTAVRYRHRTFI